ncbi:MAG: hypothetical protein AB3X44_07115 [Leptothrix sp. (in: b-proteobacteria)]
MQTPDGASNGAVGASLSEETRAELTARIGKDEALRFEAAALSLLPVLRGECEIERMPDPRKLEAVQRARRDLEAAIQAMNAPANETSRKINTPKQKSQKDSGARIRKIRKDSTAGKAPAFGWFLLFTKLAHAGVLAGMGSTSPAMLLLEKVAQDLDALNQGHPRALLVSTINAGKSAPALDTSAWDMRHGPIQPRPPAGQAKMTRARKKDQQVKPTPRTGSAFGDMALALSSRPVKGEK